MSKDQRSTLMLLITSIIWGIGFVAQRAGGYFMDPFTFNFVRFALGGFALVPVLFKLEQGKISRTTAIAGLIGGTVVFIAVNLQQWGVIITGSASKAGFITGLYIIFVPILGILIKRKAPKNVWVGAVLAAVGLYFLSAPGDQFNIDIGTVILLICAFFWAVHILVIDRFIEGARPIGFSIMQCVAVSGLSFVAALIFGDIQPANILAGWLPVAYAAFVSTGIAYTLQVVAQQHVPPGRSAVIFSSESIWATTAEAILLGTFLSALGYVGGGLIVAGIIVAQLGRKMH